MRRYAAMSLLATTAWYAPPAFAAPLDLTRAGIVHDGSGTGDVTAIAADMLAGDLTALGAHRPGVATDLATCPQTCVVIGRYDSPLVARLAREGGVDLSMLAGTWERHVRAVIRRGDRRIVLIAGSDPRGTVYGVVDLSRALGISPWTWWADVTPRRRTAITIDDAAFVSRAPSVKYRGIFLNDEDWGLLPWAAKTYDAAKGNIGPRTYQRVFELMWRLKANTLWPAMHSVSTPFYGDPGNAPMAARYAIVVGTSHAEPMMRNNLREWDEAIRGPFDFTRRSDAILDYWRERVAATSGVDAIYTLGLRGIHDGPMQGATTTEARRAILERVIGLQRGLLAQTLKRPIDTIPQVFVAYHELQEAYDAGLFVPPDVTLMWTDDNYGWLRRLSTPAERLRPGGAGIYYHLSYWGRPHDYLWLGTTHPEMIREQMGRAWDTDARRMWIVNVGDIKPIEYLSQYFLDLAFDDRLLRTPSITHLTGFMADQFGLPLAPRIAAVMQRFYALAWERKPEFMGFGETEWVTSNRPTAYVQSDGEEAQTRLVAYADLVARAEAIAAQLPADRRDAYFELVLYPVRAAARLNERILRLDLATLYAGQNRASANWYVAAARSAHAGLLADTARYDALAQGKWRGMMDMAPRRLPVFDEPQWPHWDASAKTGCDTALWGEWINDENTLTFVQGKPDRRTVTLYGRQPHAQPWAVKSSPGGVSVSIRSGILTATNGYEQRLTLSYDGRGPVGPIALTCGGATLPIHTALTSTASDERERRVTLPAVAATTGADWERVAGLASLGAAIRARLTLPTRKIADLVDVVPATYCFSTVTATGADLRIVALPAHPIDPGHRQRIAVGFDNRPLVEIDLATVARSDRWRANVLSNTATAAIPIAAVAPGAHRLRIFPLDPGVMLDRIELTFDRARPRYGVGD
ncbi:glycosyl hydrolase 115 family protein [Sphingomonas sp. Leaf38]|uniref:glycosyl hydrolase 115 family protein n=1 Tax=Sphingomonas sp. Leaf38 TaxID=1736217 RepID=UPI0006FB3A6A|nr:glycosyl hydrolase 115 family protein [Sphingomonas sp. Leaf38]KQN32742.1 hypothetical protein ASE88_01730 [Sphingomonas sp. Leaf38]